MQRSPMQKDWNWFWKYPSTKHTTSGTASLEKGSPCQCVLPEGKIPIISSSQEDWNFQEAGKENSKSKIQPPIHGNVSIGGEESGISAQSQKNTFLRQEKKKERKKIKRKMKEGTDRKEEREKNIHSTRPLFSDVPN